MKWTLLEPFKDFNIGEVFEVNLGHIFEELGERYISVDKERQSIPSRGAGWNINKFDCGLNCEKFFEEYS